MTREERPFRKPNLRDLVPIGALLLTALLVFLFTRERNEPLTAHVEQDGKETGVYVLAELAAPTEITLDNGVTVRLSRDGASIAASPCKGQDCVRTGTLTASGACAVCLPEKTALYLTGGGQDAGVDAVAG